MTAGDIGTSITISSGGFSLTGSTCTLLANPGPFNAQGNSITLSPVVVNPDGQSATYTTTGTDFTSGGEWTLQLQVKTLAGQQYTSQPGTLYVFPLL